MDWKMHFHLELYYDAGGTSHWPLLFSCAVLRWTLFYFPCFGGQNEPCAGTSTVSREHVRSNTLFGASHQSFWNSIEHMYDEAEFQTKDVHLVYGVRGQ